MDDLTHLIQQAQQGDHKAYGQIYQLFYRRIFRYCHMNLYDREVAADICQETFVKAWKGLPKFTLANGGSFQAFLFRIARNLIIDLSRKKKEVSIEFADNIETPENFEQQVDKNDENKKLQEALLKLEETDRQIVILRFFEELSFTEVAKVTGLNEGNLRVKTHRILKKLKDILGE